MTDQKRTCKIPPLPSISRFLAGDEKGSCLSISLASSSNFEDFSTRTRAAGMSWRKIGSSELLIVSLPTCEKFYINTEIADVICFIRQLELGTLGSRFQSWMEASLLKAIVNA